MVALGLDNKTTFVGTRANARLNTAAAQYWVAQQQQQLVAPEYFLSLCCSSLLPHQLVLDSAWSNMDIIKSIRTWKPLRKSKSSQSNKTISDSSDNYCYSEPSQPDHVQSGRVCSQTSLDDHRLRHDAQSSLLYRPHSASQFEPLSKPPPHFLRPKLQGKKIENSSQPSNILE